MAPHIVAADALQGRPIVDRDGRTVGTLEDIVVDVEAGRVAYALMARERVAAMEEALVAVPWKALTPRANRDGFVIEESCA